VWLWKADYDFLQKKAEAQIAVEVERNMLQNLVFRLEAEVVTLKAEKELERHRAEAAVDEMMKLSTAMIGYTPKGVAERAPEQRAPDAMDNIFEEEDPAAVKAVIERIVDGGPEVLFAEYHGTNF